MCFLRVSCHGFFWMCFVASCAVALGEARDTSTITGTTYDNSSQQQDYSTVLNVESVTLFILVYSLWSSWQVYIACKLHHMGFTSSTACALSPIQHQRQENGLLLSSLAASLSSHFVARSNIQFSRAKHNHMQTQSSIFQLPPITVSHLYTIFMACVARTFHTICLFIQSKFC